MSVKKIPLPSILNHFLLFTKRSPSLPPPCTDLDLQQPRLDVKKGGEPPIQREETTPTCWRKGAMPKRRGKRGRQIVEGAVWQWLGVKSTSRLGVCYSTLWRQRMKEKRREGGREGRRPRCKVVELWCRGKPEKEEECKGAARRKKGNTGGKTRLRVGKKDLLLRQPANDASAIERHDITYYSKWTLFVVAFKALGAWTRIHDFSFFFFFVLTLIWGASQT